MDTPVLLPNLTVMANLIKVGQLGGLEEDKASRRAQVLLDAEGFTHYGTLHPLSLRTELRKRVERLLRLVCSEQYWLELEVEETSDPWK